MGGIQLTIQDQKLKSDGTKKIKEITMSCYFLIGKLNEERSGYFAQGRRNDKLRNDDFESCISS